MDITSSDNHDSPQFGNRESGINNTNNGNNDFNNNSSGTTDNSNLISIEYGSGVGLWRIIFKNLFLNIVTLFIYSFWGKTVIRKHLWRNVRIMNTALEYSGTGLELFKGFMLVTLVIFIPIALITYFLSIKYGDDSFESNLFNFVVLSFYFYIFGFGYYRMLNYQLSRTLWRSIRGGMSKSGFEYAWLRVKAYLLVIITLGWTIPIMDLRLRQEIIDDAVFGDMSFEFKPAVTSPYYKKLYRKYSIFWFLSLFIGVAILFASYYLANYFLDYLPHVDGMKQEDRTEIVITLTVVAMLLIYYAISPLIWSIYEAYKVITFINLTIFPEVTLYLDPKKYRHLLWVIISNHFIRFFSLGILTAIAQQRYLRFISNNMLIKGYIDVSSMQQSTIQAAKMGEGLAASFDIGAF